MNQQDNNKGFSGNPTGTNFNVNVSMPECIEIEMVNANSLSDYEHWGQITGVMSNLLVGFFVAFLTIDETKKDLKSALLCLSGLFLLFVGYSIYTAYQKRKLMKSKTKKVQMMATEVVSE